VQHERLRIISRDSPYHQNIHNFLKGAVFDKRTKSSMDDRISILTTFLFATVSRLALGPTPCPVGWVPGALSLRIKRLGREDDHSPSPSAVVKNPWSLPLLPQTSSWRGTLLSTGTKSPILRFTCQWRKPVLGRDLMTNLWYGKRNDHCSEFPKQQPLFWRDGFSGSVRDGQH
jgi:hypothetical protein